MTQHLNLVSGLLLNEGDQKAHIMPTTMICSVLLRSQRGSGSGIKYMVTVTVATE